METPHRVIGNMADDLASGAKDVVSDVAGIVKGTGNTINKTVDKPFRALIGIEGPQHIVGDVIDGFIDGATNFINQGVIGSAQEVGQGFVKALDEPVKVINNLGRMKKPGFMK